MSIEQINAMDQFRAILGADNVSEDPDRITAYETATFKTDKSIRAIITPESTEQVQACMKVATETGTQVYVISTGRNVGYGSRVPTCDQAVVMELRKLNRIVDFSEELAYVVIEPGVSQAQLYEFLQSRDSNLWMDATGSFTEHSLIGNIADRGFGHTRMADHFGQVGGMEVVLPTGELLKTGFGRFENAKGEGVYKWGVGPYVDGLFTQSNLGIITRVTLWLDPAPEAYKKFFCSLEREEDLPELIEVLRPLRLNGTLKSAMHIGNDYKVLGSVQGYPWEVMQGKTPLTPEVMQELSKKWDFGAWNASGALYGSKAEVRAATKLIKRTLKGRVKKLQFIDARTLKLAEMVAKPYQWFTGVDLTQMLKLLKPLFGLTKGVPTDSMIASTYWRKKEVPSGDLDPDRDGCGLIWVAPIAATSGANAKNLWHIVKTVLLKHGFEPTVSITLLTERAMDCVINISFDRNIEGEDERAMACHDELLKELTSNGYYPYRLSIASMGLVAGDGSPYKHLLKGVKQVVDPSGVLSSGRYGL
ncbi:FAD-binding oxidoreductase [Pseudomaricurvus alkylphenolicus]|uniref:FAD-binding oxidoreductase n=1 Tax=Pseudomaricurvus alkylphenolicus TaxID=1306991 RepID=UPI0019808A24|nr:FAD-binding oxidoreductase [Pseudomaricurvus alkylphenolicus]